MTRSELENHFKRENPKSKLCATQKGQLYLLT